jgi:prophage regulatory protein
MSKSLQNNSSLQIIRPSSLAELLQISKVSLWRMEKRGELPPRKKLSDSGRAVGWLESDIKEWLENRPNAADVAEAQK